jgi:purine-binding chemotaxis protein CheW
MENNVPEVEVDGLNLDEDTLKDRFLTFKIGSEDYAIPIEYIIEIIGIMKVTNVPNVKDFIKGIINLRGMIIPVISVRKRFNMPEIAYDERTCIIVIRHNNVSIGLIVDEVLEVLNIDADHIGPPPQTNKGTKSQFIEGIGKVGKEIKVVLALQRFLYDEEETEIIDNNNDF